MKRSILVYSIIIALFPIVLFAQANSAIDSLIIKGKQQLEHTLKNWNEQELIGVRAYFERLQHDLTYPWLVNYYIAFVDYRLVSYYFSVNNKETAKKYIDDGIDHLQLSIEMKNDFAESYSLLSSLYGNKIGVNPMMGMILGPKSGNAMSKAMKLEPKNPRNHLISGISANFTPKIFGGGKEKARKFYEQAIVYFDSVKVENPILPDWGHEEVYSWLGLYYNDKKDYQTAILNFEKSLEINPDYGWVKFSLLPEAKKQMEMIKSE